MGMPQNEMIDNKEDGYDFFNYYYPNQKEKVDSWRMTNEFYNELLDSYKERCRNFPIANIFIQNEIESIDAKIAKSKFDTLNKGFIDFKEGKNNDTQKVEVSFYAYKYFFHYDYEHKSIRITNRQGEEIQIETLKRLPKGEKFFYLRYYANGYATAKYYYYLKTLLNSQTIQQMPISHNEFDLKKYDLTTANVCPYFPEPKFDGKEYRVYEGATGNNRFQYFKVSKKSNAGKLCKQFVEKYYAKCEKRFEHYEDAEKLIAACKIDAIDKVIGLDAYLKYWNDCLTENEKLINNIYSIQHLEALKEWFNLSVEKHIQKNGALYLNDDVKNADIEQYKESITEDVSKYLKQSERTGERKFSAISKVQANELIKFYYWIVEQNEKVPNNSEIKTEQLKPIKKQSAKTNSYSIKQIAIAYSIMNILITSENAETILKKHSNFISASKLLQKRISKVSELSKISENKTVDTKHLKDLQAAKRLMSGMKNTKAINDIDRVITAFTTAYNNKY